MKLLQILQTIQASNWSVILNSYVRVYKEPHFQDGIPYKGVTDRKQGIYLQAYFNSWMLLHHVKKGLI